MGKKRTRMGRKPLNPEDKLSRIVTLRLKPSEYEQLANDASAADRTVTDYLRDCWQESRLE